MGQAFTNFRAALRADHGALAHAAQKYGGSGSRVGGLASDLLRKAGFQLLAAYRLMRLFDEAGLELLAQATSRMIRHLYGADIHWKARFEPGVMVVHGMGLCINQSARVGRGGVLFQNVTLGEGIDPATREIGAPLLEADVHVGPGATLLGPITIGHGSKIMAGCVVVRSVPARSLVEAAVPLVKPRADLTSGCLESDSRPENGESTGALP